jgi:molybdenum cofactor cytidylyltransferase
VTPAIVLAAGASTRMGRPKALLDAGGSTFVHRILTTLRDGGVSESIVVVRSGDVMIAREVAAAGRARAIENPQPERGQLSSLIVGLDAADKEGIEAVLVTLVDVPLITSATVAMLLAHAARSSAPIVRAVDGGRHGHPVIFKRAVFDALRHADPAQGAKAVLRAHAVDDVETGDPAVAIDVDTPDDYRRLPR